MSKKLWVAFLVLSVVAILIFLLFGLVGLSGDVGTNGLIQCVIAIIVAYCSLSTAMRFVMLPKPTKPEKKVVNS